MFLLRFLKGLFAQNSFREEFGFSPPTEGIEPSQSERQMVSQRFDELLHQFGWAKDAVYWAQDDAKMTGKPEDLRKYRRAEADFYAVQSALRKATELAEKFGFGDLVDGLIRHRLETKVERTRPYQAIGYIG